MTCIQFGLKTLLIIVSMAAMYLAGRASVRDQRGHEEINFRVPVSIHCERTALRDVVVELGRQANIPVQFDERRFRDHSVDLDHPITMDLDSQIQFRSALNLVLSHFDLGYYVKDRTVIITDEALASQARHRMNQVSRGRCGVPW